MPRETKARIKSLEARRMAGWTAWRRRRWRSCPALLAARIGTGPRTSPRNEFQSPLLDLEATHRMRRAAATTKWNGPDFDAVRLDCCVRHGFNRMLLSKTLMTCILLMLHLRSSRYYLNYPITSCALCIRIYSVCSTRCTLSCFLSCKFLIRKRINDSLNKNSLVENEFLHTLPFPDLRTIVRTVFFVLIYCVCLTLKCCTS